MSKTNIRELPVPLTDDEKLDRSKRLADALAERTQAEEEMKLARAAWKERDGIAEAEIRHLARTIRAGAEVRPVPCSERENWAQKTIETYRDDTGERIDFRAMTAGELQRKLDLGSDKVN